MLFNGHKLTIGVELGDRWSFYCVLDKAGEIMVEQKVDDTGSDEAGTTQLLAKISAPDT
jgi:hypothetical protein